MRTYVVQEGDTPASIAAQPSMAGCPKCSRDILAVNKHKKTVTLPNGYETFRELRAGERINLPDKWFDGSLDRRPQAYFAALPYADGRTPSTLGLAAAGILGDYAALDAATARLSSISLLDNQSFSAAVDSTASSIDQSVHEADGSSNPGIAAYAAAVHIATGAAVQHNQEMAKSLAAGDQVTADQARTGVQGELLTAIDAAHLALQAVYGGTATATPVSGDLPANIVTIAQAVATAVASDPNYCASIGQVGSAANTAVHAFKVAWNSANPSAPLPIGTGTYEQATADAVARVLGTAPAACAARAPAPVQVQPPVPMPVAVVAPPQKTGLSTGAVLGLGLLGVGAVGGAIYLATSAPQRVALRRVGETSRSSRTPRPRKRPKYARGKGWYWDGRSWQKACTP